MDADSEPESKCAKAPKTRNPLLKAEEDFVARQERLEYERVDSGRPYNEQLKLFVLKIIGITPIPACYQDYLLGSPSEWEIQKRMERRQAWYGMHHRVQQYLTDELGALSTYCEPSEYRQNVLKIFKRTNTQLKARESFYRNDVQGQFNQTIRDNVMALPFFSLLSPENWLNGPACAFHAIRPPIPA